MNIREAKNAFRKKYCHIDSFSHIYMVSGALIIHVEGEVRDKRYPKQFEGYEIYQRLIRKPIDPEIVDDPSIHESLQDFSVRLEAILQSASLGPWRVVPNPPFLWEPLPPRSAPFFWRPNP